MQCDSIFTLRSTLTTHIKSVHEGAKCDCNQCDYRATQQGSLTTHIKPVHEETSKLKNDNLEDDGEMPMETPTVLKSQMELCAKSQEGWWQCHNRTDGTVGEVKKSE